MKIAKRILSLLLALSMMASFMLIAPVAYAEEEGTAVLDQSSTETIAPEEQPVDVEPVADKVFYLFGHINDADYGCESDYENMGQYQFVNGSLVATFTSDSYVAVKEKDNANWYMFKAYCDATSGTLYNTSTGAGEKMFVPANVEVTFTLVENADGTLTLSYSVPSCNHSYTEKVIKKATCIADGQSSFTCKHCGDTYTKAIPATGHKNTCKVNAATCLTYASYELTCTVCGKKEVLKADELAYKGLDAVPNGMDPKLFTDEPLYRYRTQKLIASFEPTMDGYTLVDTKWVSAGSASVKYVSKWPAGFDTANELFAAYNNAGKKVTATENADEKVVVDSDKITGYLYFHWCREGHPYTVAVGDADHPRFHAYYSTKTPDDADRYDISDSSYRFDDSTACEDSAWYFAVPVYEQSYTTYDKQYIFESWSDWTDWSTTPVAQTDSREVETIIGYRYANPTLGDHKFADGFCTVCGTFDPDNIGYHLVGYINGADYGCESDYANAGIYRFKDGKLKATFTKSSYVFVKTSDNVNWYMSKVYVEGTGGVLYPTTEAGATEKIYVPAGMEITFTLVENDDGSLSLSFVAAEPDCSHSYTAKMTTATTCTTDGVKTYTCSKCGHMYSETVAASGHVNKCKVNAATCTTYASYELTCTVCGFHQILKADELVYTGLDAVPNGMDPKLFTTDPLYRYRFRKTATSYEPTMEGYIPIGTTWVEFNNATIYYVSGWPAGFDKTNSLYAEYDNIDKKVKPSESDTAKLEIKSDKVVGYLYYHWCYEEHPDDYSTAQKDDLFVNFCAFYSTTAPSNYPCDYGDMSYKVGYDNCTSSPWFFVVEVYGQNYSESDKQYAFESWSEWSQWSTTAVTATANREVETITGYRFANASKGAHAYMNGVCTNCKAADPEDFYLVGYINGANYGCEEDYQNLGTYRFVNGKLTVTFAKESYVFLKKGDNATWFMFDKYCDTASGKLFNTSTGSAEKMAVPAGVQVTFTLVKNADGSLTMSYVTACTHSYTSKITTAATCTKAGVRTYTCSVCGNSYTESIAATGHSITSKVTTAATCTAAGVKTFACSKCSYSYTEAIAAVGHSYVNGSCSACGAADPEAAVDYYLFGWINGANYGCEEDYQNLGQYKFVNGKLVAKFANDSYVAIKDSRNANWYMFDAYCDKTTGTLKNTSTGAAEKMLVPGGVEITFTLVVNADDSLTLSYVAQGNSVVVPTLKLSYPTLSFEDEILYNAYFTISDISSVVEMGMITFASKLTGGTMADAVEVILGYTTAGSSYIVSSKGIPAKNLGDALYFKVYAKLSDGSYAYSDIAGYNAVAYANTILNSAKSTAKAKALVVAMLNYGAAAQTYFGYNTNNLMNAKLTAEQQALVEDYDESMINDVINADDSKVGVFTHNGGYTKLYPTVSFQGAFAINWYFATKYTPDSALTFYYWDSSTYNSASKLTPENATGTATMTADGAQWTTAIKGIAAKSIDETYYIAATYYVGKTLYTSPVIAYSLGKYCETVAGNGEAFGAATAVYGYYAKAYFA